MDFPKGSGNISKDSSYCAMLDDNIYPKVQKMENTKNYILKSGLSGSSDIVFGFLFDSNISSRLSLHEDDQHDQGGQLQHKAVHPKRQQPGRREQPGPKAADNQDAG